ncbi:MAG: S8 family serine peptidase [Bacteroidales bacterium]|nr:S8 family serine peptidase [Bacteroidales bacterium]
MKKIAFFSVFLLSLVFCSVQAQNCYWVMLTDKAGTTFDPYSYFDNKAIERYKLNEADLYDISNYPLKESYVSQIDAIATEDFGQSRWLNAVAVTATPEQIDVIQKLPFVKEVVMLESNIYLAKVEDSEPIDLTGLFSEGAPADQLIRMGRDNFRNAGIDGKGVRIAVFDGGFPQVNTHIAFKHLRDEGRIIKTWNFPDKKENVYGWNSHGLMTLSCIAGIHRYEGTDGEVSVDIGMATGAEFLLARTEIEAEPFKEEVWWQMAVEWADKNGAQIISSSLGYGKDRYYTKDMNGQSYVAKAANMAARKGILVCNSAGNEGSDRSWRTIITPSDADSVLCVGGISNSLTKYEHISFSSYGPSADGRQKPNVVAFGHAYTANTSNSNNKYHFVDGTSFSCPLVAGFAACALQAKPGLTAMQLFHEIEKSADLYPYCDYTFGYGVPQADYFTSVRKEIKRTFNFEKSKNGAILIRPVKDLDKCRIFIKNTLKDGSISNYSKYDLTEFKTTTVLEVYNGEKITVNLDGFTDSCRFDKPDYSIRNCETYFTIFVDNNDVNNGNLIVSSEVSNTHFSNTLKEKKTRLELFVMFGLPVNTQSDEMESLFWSPSIRGGLRGTYYFSKSYGWGIGASIGKVSYRFGDKIGTADVTMGTDLIANANFNGVESHKLEVGELGLEIYQRVRLVPGGLFHKGWHWDLGVYGNWSFNSYTIKGIYNGTQAERAELVLSDMDALKNSRWNYGITTRITRDWFGIFARYRLNGLGKTVPANELCLPRLEAGLQMAF